MAEGNMSGSKPSVASALTEDDRLRVESRIWNWVDWGRNGGEGGGECSSAEHRYRSKAADSESLVAAVCAQSIDGVDAEKVERAVRALPKSNRAYIDMFYVERRSARYVQQKLKYKADLQVSMRSLVLLALKAELSRVQRTSPLIKRGAPIWAGLAKR